MRPRYLAGQIESLAFRRGRMVFLSGPRQCGKTTLAKMLLSARDAGRYYNWDDPEFRKRWARGDKSLFAFGGTPKPLLALDEIHKSAKWKRQLKGFYDTLEAPCDVLVTGSARLNVYRRGGDSMMGRYLHFRLHPFSLGEIAREPDGPIAGPDEVFSSILHRKSLQDRAGSLNRLLEFSGFPEPLFSVDADFLRLWRRGRVEKIVREDLRDLSRIHELGQIEVLISLLPERVGSLFSLKPLREDLEVAHETLKRWLDYLKELYYFFEVKPYVRSIPRSLKKEGKIFLWDWTEVEDPGARFENLVAAHLLKACHYWTDVGKGDFELFYLRNKERQEVDFLIVRDRRPWISFEVKASDDAFDASIMRFQPHSRHRLHVQLVNRSGVSKALSRGGLEIRILSASAVLGLLA